MSFASMTVTGLTWGAVLPHGAANEFAGYKPGDAWAQLRDTATAWDSLGYDHLWGSDHFMPAGPDRTGINFEPYTLLAAISQVTARARLGVLVSCAQYRSAGLLAKQAANVDVMSGGRLIFALGGGWDEEEFAAFGLAFPSAAERVGRFGETLEAVLRLWDGPAADFDGTWVRLRNASCSPRPVRRPPVWTGTHGRRGLRYTARFADVANWNTGLADFRRLSAELHEACAETGRDPGTISTSVFRLADLSSGSDDRLRRLVAELGAPPDAVDTIKAEHFIGPAEQVIPKVQAFADAGARHVIILPLDAPHSMHTAQSFLHDVVPGIHLPG
jgi:alkanesulfonate monooxygenase SsuD/methylene tetrahydromethanopterin reductase-like flavin-dependent oxidoreductase (luciferase family)